MKTFSGEEPGPRGAAKRRPTMKDVAAVAGVSLATVSRVITGSEEVRPDLAARVWDAVELLGYRRDLRASALRRADRLSASVGLVFEDVSNPFFSAVHRGVEEVARARGVLVLAGSSDDDPDRERDLVGAFAARGVDGMIVVPCGPDQSYLRRDQEAGVALVFVDRPPRFIDADAVLSDNAGSVRAAVTRLIEAGHRRIGFLGDRQRIYTAAERLRGYRDALAAHGIPEDPELVAVDLTGIEMAEEAARGFLAGPSPPSALFAGQNLITVGALRALRDAGLQHRVALVGHDEVVLGDIIEPGVTVIAQDAAELGRRAADLLFSRVEGYDGPSREVILPTTYIPRGSGELAPPAS